MLQAILIEDNADAEEKLRFLLTKYCTDSIQIQGSANSGQAAIAAIGANQPDLVFLDIELGDMTAFEMLERIDSINFQVIFTTAHDHYAIKAIRYSAVDYLQKPIGREELLARSCPSRKQSCPHPSGTGGFIGSKCPDQGYNAGKNCAYYSRWAHFYQNC